VSLYGLSVEPATPLGRAVAEGRVPAVDEERYRAEYLFATDFLRAEGYEHYEVSNFARPGHASRHNAVYWDGRPYLGIGNGAHSYAHPLRRWNVRDWAAYQERVVAGRSPEEARERVDDGAHRMERIWLGLRTRRGVPAPAAGSPGEALMRRWRREGWATLEEERVRLTPEGWLILDELSVQLDAVEAG
jgi:oxygen-independent coproporphyrinogen-3 oxidase